MGVIDHISDMFDCSTGSHSKHKRRKQLQVNIYIYSNILTYFFSVFFTSLLLTYFVYEFFGDLLLYMSLLPLILEICVRSEVLNKQIKLTNGSIFA